MTRSVPYKNWSNRDVALLLLGIFLCIIFSSLLLCALMPVIAERFPDHNNLIIIVFNTFSFQGVAAVLILLFLHNQKMTWKKAFGFCRSSFVTHGLHGILWGLAAFPVSLVLLEALGWRNSCYWTSDSDWSAFNYCGTVCRRNTVSRYSLHPY